MSVEAAKQTVYHGYSLGISLTVLSYDFMLTMDQEVELLWKAPWSFLKTISLIHRYGAFTVLVNIFTITMFHPEDIELCRKLYLVSSWSFYFTYSLSELIFCLRAYAMWEASPKVQRGLVIFYCCSVISIGGCIYLLTHDMEVVETDPWGSCHIAKMNNVALFCGMVLELVLEVVLAILTLLRAKYYLKGTNRQNVPLLHLLYRDGVIYFFHAALLTLTNIVFMSWRPVPYLSLQVVSSLQRVLYNILSVRVVLHLRSQYSSSSHKPHLVAQDRIISTDTASGAHLTSQQRCQEALCGACNKHTNN